MVIFGDSKNLKILNVGTKHIKKEEEKKLFAVCLPVILSNVH